MCDASTGSLSSYSYIILLIHYLQQVEPPVVPVLQQVCVCLSVCSVCAASLCIANMVTQLVWLLMTSPLSMTMWWRLAMLAGSNLVYALAQNKPEC